MDTCGELDLLMLSKVTTTWLQLPSPFSRQPTPVRLHTLLVLIEQAVPVCSFEMLLVVSFAVYTSISNYFPSASEAQIYSPALSPRDCLPQSYSFLICTFYSLCLVLKLPWFCCGRVSIAFFLEHLSGRSDALLHCSRKLAVFRFADTAFEWTMWEMLSFVKSILKNSQMQKHFILNVGNSM